MSIGRDTARRLLHCKDVNVYGLCIYNKYIYIDGS